MVHIVRAGKDNKEFMAVNLGNNREPLAITETEKSKQSIFKNLEAQLNSLVMYWHDVGFYVQDDTLKIAKVYYVYNGKKYDKNLSVEPEAPYKLKKKKREKLSSKNILPNG